MMLMRMHLYINKDMRIVWQEKVTEKHTTATALWPTLRCQEGQELYLVSLMRLMHGWPGKTLFWLLSRTTPAARTVPRFGRLKPLLFHIPFGFVTSLSCP